MTREAEAVLEQDILREEALEIMTEDYSFVDAIVDANDKESIFDN